MDSGINCLPQSAVRVRPVYVSSEIRPVANGYSDCPWSLAGLRASRRQAATIMDGILRLRIFIRDSGFPFPIVPRIVCEPPEDSSSKNLLVIDGACFNSPDFQNPTPDNYGVDCEFM